VPKETINNMKIANHLISELKILKMLNGPAECPFIVKLHENFKNDENVYFLMEYVRGSTLHY
jgi:cGMP-dependent protein kinase